MLAVAAVRSIAFYLPQFHPIPENDLWWGPGFTEWTNVARARRFFSWQTQPRLPADLGFYDLRLDQTRIDQAALAQAYGVEAFCYYHYWFSGRRLLETPLNRMLSSGVPDFPFCVCWANENWTRVWDGGSRAMLMQQRYDAVDHHEHVRSLLPVFADSRYLRVDGRPVFLVYRASQIPEVLAATDVWRSVARAEGIGEILLLRVNSFSDEKSDPRALGFDAAVEFQPDFALIDSESRRWGRRVRRLLSHGKPTVDSYDRLVQLALDQAPPPYPFYPCVSPSWDNSPRRGDGGLVLRDSTPEKFGRWTSTVVDRLLSDTVDREGRLLFVNAWNEWAEGNYLEPDLQWGRAYLEAHRRAVVREG